MGWPPGGVGALPALLPASAGEDDGDEAEAAAAVGEEEAARLADPATWTALQEQRLAAAQQLLRRRGHPAFAPPPAPRAPTPEEPRDRLMAARPASPVRGVHHRAMMQQLPEAGSYR